jgi:hypothetical protein
MGNRKAVIAMKGLNSNIAPSTITSWDFFNSRVLQDLKSYPFTHLKAFEKNILSWSAREDSSSGVGTATTVAVGGMKTILLGGEWSKINANKEPDSVTIPKVTDFLNALIFMQVVQNQGVSSQVHTDFWSTVVLTLSPDLLLDSKIQHRGPL